ncbi:hypothetical protein ACWL8E_003584 [Escherichia coli]|uniref:hypothetical protein n=1 Tax=Escherichia coli TaxID=562 RepID=UPI00182C4CC3|nr:hypothetical protein [Escherichia coli]EEV6085262.1 hypothetical protein [Escherichia coli]EFD0637413.1 hypothetical protein [Escherichia coli]
MNPRLRKAWSDLISGAKWDIIALVVIAFVIYFLRCSLRFVDIKDVVGTLQNISAAIFTIIGLWIGFLYPNAIQGIVSDNVDYIKNTKDAPRIERLIYVIIVSALVMLGTLVFYIFKSLLGNTVLYVEYKAYIKYIALVFVFYLCWLQSRCIFSVIISNFRFANNLYSRINESKLKHD